MHRVLESVLAGKPIIDKKMEEKCKQTSERERAAMECERAGNKYKQVEFMKSYVGQDFEGIISGVAGFGFFVETVEHKCEGMVSIISLSDVDEFYLVEGDYSLAGKRSGRKFKMGDKVWIKVISANLDKRQLDYQWVNKPITSSVPTAPIIEKEVKKETPKKESVKKVIVKNKEVEKKVEVKKSVAKKEEIVIEELVKEVPKVVKVTKAKAVPKEKKVTKEKIKK